MASRQPWAAAKRSTEEAGRGSHRVQAKGRPNRLRPSRAPTTQESSQACLNLGLRVAGPPRARLLRGRPQLRNAFAGGALVKLCVRARSASQTPSLASRDAHLETARQTPMSTSSPTKTTRPSQNATFAPPACWLRVGCVHMPRAARRASEQGAEGLMVPSRSSAPLSFPHHSR